MPRRNYNRNAPRPLHKDFVEMMLLGESTIVEKRPRRKRSKREGREKAAYHS